MTIGNTTWQIVLSVYYHKYVEKLLSPDPTPVLSAFEINCAFCVFTYESTKA